MTSQQTSGKGLVLKAMGEGTGFSAYGIHIALWFELEGFVCVTHNALLCDHAFIKQQWLGLVKWISIYY